LIVAIGIIVGFLLITGFGYLVIPKEFQCTVDTPPDNPHLGVSAEECTSFARILIVLVALQFIPALVLQWLWPELLHWYNSSTSSCHWFQAPPLSFKASYKSGFFSFNVSHLIRSILDCIISYSLDLVLLANSPGWLKLVIRNTIQRQMRPP
jgi:hypothetical protein